MRFDLQAFWANGMTAEMPQYLQNKVKASNMVGLALMLIAFSYWLISAIFNPELNFIPIFGVVAVGGAGLLNFIGLINFSRFILGIVPTALATFYQAYLVKAGGEPLAGLMLLSLSFSTIPFVLFDLREGAKMFMPIVVCFLLMLGFPYLRDSFELPLDDSLYRTGILYHITLVIAFALCFLNVWSLAYLSIEADKQSQELLRISHEQNGLMQQKEKELQENLVQLQAAQEEERRRSWASEGFSRFGTLLRQQSDTQTTYDALLAGIIKYVKANQGGLYLAEGEGKDTELVLRSAYAYDRKKYREHRVSPGQSLVGQCYLEQDYVYLKVVPQHYVAITSGLGDATPSALLIIPLMTEQGVMGVLELASFHAFPQHVIEFLMRLGQDIAATIHIDHTNQLTRRLLEQAQEQTEQMRAQEEEMRQNMEELSATQEEIYRKEREYMRQIEQLEAALQQQQHLQPVLN